MMRPSDLREWAKEEVIDAIDAMVAAKCQANLDWDDLEVLRIQRNRVGKFLGFPPATLSQIVERMLSNG